jgi:hypothetical protein
MKFILARVANQDLRWFNQENHLETPERIKRAHEPLKDSGALKTPWV